MEIERVYNAAFAWREELLYEVEKLALPGNPLDVLIDNLGGPSCVVRRRSIAYHKSSKMPFVFIIRGVNKAILCILL